jgi:hypothetical protein
LASGEYVKSSSSGFFGGVGVEFLRKRRVGFGLEISVDTAEIELEKVINYYESTTENVKPAGVMISVFAVF